MRAARPPLLLVLVVLAVHLIGGETVSRIQDGWRDRPPPVPPRMQVSLVQELQLSETGRPPSPPALPAPPQRVAPGAAVALPSAELPPAPELPPEPVAPTAPPVPQVAAASAPDGAPGPEWPLSTRLVYDLTGSYRGPIHGQATVEWLRKGSDYQVHLDVAVGPSFAPFITRRMSSQGRLTPEGIAPQRFDEDTRFLMNEPRRATVFFLGDSLQMANGAREARPRGAQDAASQFVHLTWLLLTGREPLTVGHVIAMPLVLPRRVLPWQYELRGEEVVATPFGEVRAWHLKPSREAGGGDLTAEVWLAPGLQFLPVRILIRQDEQTRIDLLLKSAPLQESPDTSRRPTP